MAANEQILAESDAMSSMAAELELSAEFNGGLIKGLLRKYLGGESLFISRFSNTSSSPKKLTLVQATPGEIGCLELTNDQYFLQPGAYLASTTNVQLGLKWAGLVSWIAGEGLFKLVAQGTGKLWFGTYGALLVRDIDGEFVVDSSHLVAYSPGIELKLQLAGGIFSSWFGGEGLVTRVQGKGQIIIQTRSLSGLADWINPKLP